MTSENEKPNIDLNKVVEPVIQEFRKEEARFSEDRSGKAESDVIDIRTEKILKFFKESYNWIAYLLLAVIVFFAVRIRTRNLSGLRDITTGTWTLGPDLDPFLFLRYAKYIVEHGSLMAVDMMRYVPVGFDLSRGFVLHYYLIAWFHKYLGPVFGTESVTHSAVLFPAFMFGLTIIAFFLMVKKIFLNLGEKNANAIGLVASFLLSILPVLLSRTIAGIPEKESAAFLFFFLTFYFFLCAWQSDGKIKGYVFSVLAGFSTAAMALIWGGFAFIFITLSPVVYVSFLLGKIDKRQIYVYGIWILSSFAPMYIFSTRYSLTRLLTSVETGSSVFVLLIIVAHFAVFSKSLRKYFQSGILAKIPPRVSSTIAVLIILLVLASIILGMSYVPDRISDITRNLIKPANSRLIQTVAENRQPYFNEWASSYGPNFKGVLLIFWLAFLGSIYLFWNIVKNLRRNEKIFLTLAYTFFLTATVFSRYASGSIFNGENTISLSFYGIGFLIFIVTFGKYYYTRYLNGELGELRSLDFGLIFSLSFFFLGILAAKAAVRSIMVLAPPTAIIVSYFAVATFMGARSAKKNSVKKIVAIGLAVIVVYATVFSGFSYYNLVNAQAANHVPSVYTQQWQKAMFWVRENVRSDAVFGHWWDYGYWVQSIGERATVLDGGNGISYWNHMMGRYALTGTDNREALEFLYAHNTTHFLIDSTDIGKYSAYSLIGSDVSYDRASQIPVLLRNDQGTQEKNGSIVYVFNGGFSADEEIIYENNGSNIVLPRGATGVGGILIELDNNGNVAGQPLGAFIYQGQQYTLPLRYAYYQGSFVDFGFGVESGVFIFHRVSQNGGSIEKNAALLYLSERTVKSQLARLYLYNEDNPNFNLVHSEDDFVMSQIKDQNPGFPADFIYLGGLRGPIKIWEINYPDDIEFKEEYVDKIYPKELRLA